MHPVRRHSRMPANKPRTFLLASPEPALLTAVEPVLRAMGARVEVVLSARATLAAMTAPKPPELVLLDYNLPGMAMGQLLAAARAEAGGKRYPIILISDTVTEEWIDRLSEGVIDDLILRADEMAYWQLRLDMVMRTHHLADELDTLREYAATNAQLDRLTGVYNRDALLAMLFRETDRVQRQNSSLCLVLFDIDDFGHWNSRLGADACDELLCQVVRRTTRLLRSCSVSVHALQVVIRTSFTSQDRVIDFELGVMGCRGGLLACRISAWSLWFAPAVARAEEHTSELQSLTNLG